MKSYFKLLQFTIIVCFAFIASVNANTLQNISKAEDLIVFKVDGRTVTLNDEVGRKLFDAYYDKSSVLKSAEKCYEFYKFEGRECPPIWREPLNAILRDVVEQKSCQKYQKADLFRKFSDRQREVASIAGISLATLDICIAANFISKNHTTISKLEDFISNNKDTFRISAVNSIRENPSQYKDYSHYIPGYNEIYRAYEYYSEGMTFWKDDTRFQPICESLAQSVHADFVQQNKYGDFERFKTSMTNCEELDIFTYGRLFASSDLRFLEVVNSLNNIVTERDNVIREKANELLTFSVSGTDYNIENQSIVKLAYLCAYENVGKPQGVGDCNRFKEKRIAIVNAKKEEIEEEQREFESEQIKQIPSQIAEIYAEYRKQDILCGEAIDLAETEELMGSIINSLLIMMKAAEGDFDSIKNEAWDKSESIQEAEEQWEFLKTLYSSLSKSKKQQSCNEMNSQTNQMYRMLEMQLKQQIKKDQPKEKKKRKF